MNAPDMLRAAAQTLSDHPDPARAPALAGLLQNRAADMERSIALWRRAGQDVPVLVERHYGVYLAVARAVLFDSHHGLDRTAPFPRTS
jgi:hypothetical protein